MEKRYLCTNNSTNYILSMKNLTRLTSLLAILLIAVIPAMGQSEKVPAFPGAEGHGRYVTGGRGGKIIHVTNLDDSGDGSFREAVKGNSKKIVVFDVAGVIALNSDITIGDNTTILGQTAPAPGITLRYRTVNPGGNNIIRFIRIRRGQERNVNDGADASNQKHKTGIIFDHCSFSWSIDEVASFYDNNNFTMQWCTVAEALTNSGHNKGAHGYGGIWGGKLASFHHNLLAHLSNRGPRFNGARYEWNGYTSNYDYDKYKWSNCFEAENVDFRNCLMYNAQSTCYGGPGGGQVNIVNNYYKNGPKNDDQKQRVTLVTVANGGNSDKNSNVYDMTSRYYIKGNTTELRNGEKTANRDWDGVEYDNGTITQNGDHYSMDKNKFYPATVPSIEKDGVRWIRIRMDEECPTGNITTHTADEAYERVLDYAGASLHRDEVDERYEKECREGIATYKGSVTKTWGIIDVVADVNGYTEKTFPTGQHPAGYDTDGDGIPDDWEKQWGLNPNDPSDAKAYTIDSEKKYYTNLEMYANSLVEDIMKDELKDGDANYEEYWPVLKKAETVKPNPGAATEVEINLDATTSKSIGVKSNWTFIDNDYTVTITNTKSKSCDKGKEDGIKYSADTQYSISLPAGMTITSMEVKGYDNYADKDSYISEINGIKYGADKYLFPKKIDSNNYIVKTYAIPMAAAGTITFTPSGKQVVFSITLKGTIATAISNLTAETATKDIYYNVAGNRVSANTKGIILSNGKKKVVK